MEINYMLTEKQKNARRFLCEVINPTLKEMDLYSPAEAQLLLGTAIQESLLIYRKQLESGRALSYYQIEPATHNDIWENYLKYKPELAAKLIKLMSSPDADKLHELQYNDRYATGIARVYYLRKRKSTPSLNDISAIAGFWKDNYNTEGGKGKRKQFIEKWHIYRACTHFKS